MAALLLLGLFFFLPVLYLFFLRPSSNLRLPPGPFSWPLIGTLLPKVQEHPHVELSNLAKKYGPLMLLKFGVESVVVASNHTAAMEVLKNHDRVLSGRFVPRSARIPGYIEHSMVWADCTDYWKHIRKIWRTELFSTKMLDAQSHVRERKVSELVEFLRGNKDGEVVKFADLIFGAILNILGALIFDRDVHDYYDKSDKTVDMKGTIRQLMVLAADPNNAADLYPILRWSDFQGLRKATAKCVQWMNDSWAAIVKERRADKNGSHTDFLQVLIDAGFNDAQIDALLLEIFGPGSDTSTAIIEWAMSELMRQPEKLQKVRDELDTILGKKAPKDSDLPNLPYLHAVVKETLRLHPPVTFLLPHRAMETCEVMNHTIPKDSQLMVNTYAIGRDPETWENPQSFVPERFINSDVDYLGNNFQYIPFGAGRRICPGISLATRVIRLILASLIYNFDWSLPDGMHHYELDMSEKFGLALLKDVPLLVVPKVRA